MSLYYPQGALILNVRWEDFGSGEEVLQNVSKIPVLARTLNVMINDYREADKFDATIDFNAFPFDPRCIRAIGVTICMEDRKVIFDKNKLALIEPTEENIIFTGFADEANIIFDDESKTLRIEGRDFTSLLIDVKRINTAHISLGKRIDIIIQELLNEQEATKEIEIVNRTGEELPILAKVAKDFNPTTTVKNQKRKETYWDIIQSIISRTALIAFIDRDKLIIDKPQNIYAKKQFKQLIYGGNIKNLEFSRKLGRLKDFNVKVLSINLEKKKITEAKLPEEARPFLDDGIPTINPFIARFGNKRNTIPQLDKDGKKITPEKDADFITFRIPNITSKNELIKIGEAIYEEMGIQQIEGKLSTFEMEIPEELDIIENGFIKTNPVSFNTIRNGSAINLYLSTEELRAVNSDSKKSEKIQFLINRGYPRDIAEAFASSLNRINTPFYVKSVQFELSQDDGFEMNIDFINFIDIDNALLRK